MPQDVKKGETGNPTYNHTRHCNQFFFYFSLITEEYVEVDERERQPNSEQKKWESEQLASAMFQFGAKDAKIKDEYDLLLDDQIEFIQALTMEGSKSKDKKPEITETEKHKMDIEETKKSLPVYPFKEDLIAAIQEHQVMLF